MIIVCPKCNSRLQLDEAKVSSRSFTIRCPKCNSNVDSGPPNSVGDQSAVAAGGSPSTGNPRFEQPKPAPLYELERTGNETSASATEKLVELLSGIVSQPGAHQVHSEGARPSWNPRKALVCVPKEHRDGVARNLAENGYQVFVAEDAKQAVERMRENRLDVVLLDPKFDPAEQGAVFIRREVSILRPAQRRRLFFVLLSSSVRTMDSHAAFLSNVNAVVNTNEIGELPQLIEHRVREYNELYKDFNSALRLPAL
jgi:predicted Zn finger-like uncharacterized protein